MKGHRRRAKESVHPQYHTFDDTYTSVILKWCKMEFTVESAQMGDDFYLYVEPVKLQPKPALAVLECGFFVEPSGNNQKRRKYLACGYSGKGSHCACDKSRS